MLTRPETSGWNDKRLERMISMWADGYSASQIAADLGGGITRNAVIGKVHRLGLAGHARVPVPRAPAAPRQPKPRRARAAREPRAIMPARVARALEIAAEAPPAPAEIVASIDIRFPVARRCSLMELSDARCRWPVGDPQAPEFFFCGAPAAEPLPYCPRCARVAYEFEKTQRSLRGYQSAWRSGREA